MGSFSFRRDQDPNMSEHRQAGGDRTTRFICLPEDVDRSRKELKSEFTISLLAYYCFYNKLPQI